MPSPQVLMAALLGGILALYLFFSVLGTFEGMWQAFDLLSLRVLNVLLALSALAGLIHSAIRRRSLHALMYLLCLGIFLTGMYAYLYRFSGKLAIAEGEFYSGLLYVKSDAGLLAGPPFFPFGVRRVEPDGRAGYVELIRRDNTLELLGPEGRYENGYWLRYEKPGPSLLFHIGLRSEGSVEESYMKLDLDNELHEDYFMFRMLPFQFLVRDGGGDNVYLLDVRRGKLSIYNGAMRPGDVVDFDGIKLTFKNARKYAIMDVRRTPGLRLMGVFAMGLLVAAGWALYRGIRARRA